MGKTRIVIVESHPAFRRILRELLAGDSDCELVGELVSATEFAQALPKLAPDAAIVDISLDGGHGLEASRTIKQLSPGTKVVILAEEDSKAYQRAIQEAGASAGILKESLVRDLVACLRQVALQ